MGNDLESCIAALDSDDISEELHILERISMSFLVQNAILNAPNITRFKISGQLPVLQVNFSDNKYSAFRLSLSLRSALFLGLISPSFLSV
jgi:vacuolar protein sorting-associated protein 13A/C